MPSLWTSTFEATVKLRKSICNRMPHYHSLVCQHEALHPPVSMCVWLLVVAVYTACCRIAVQPTGHCHLMLERERVDHGFSVARQAKAGLLLQPRLDDVLYVGTSSTIRVDVVQLHLRHALISPAGTCNDQDKSEGDGLPVPCMITMTKHTGIHAKVPQSPAESSPARKATRCRHSSPASKLDGTRTNTLKLLMGCVVPAQPFSAVCSCRNCASHARLNSPLNCSTHSGPVRQCATARTCCMLQREQAVWVRVHRMTCTWGSLLGV